MELHAPLAPKFVARALTEKTDWLHLSGIDGVNALHSFDVAGHLIAIDEGPDETAIMHQVYHLWRCIDKFSIALGQRIGRHPLHHQDRYIDHGQEYHGGHGQGVAAQFPPHQRPLRGQEKPFLFFGQPFNRMRVERGVGDPVLFLITPHGHFEASEPSRMRGSRAARARSETNIPTTVRAARNNRNEPARY